MQPLGTRFPTEHLRVLKNLLKRVYAFQIELESGSVGFLREGKTRVPGEKLLGVKERTNNKLNPGFEPGHIGGCHCATFAPLKVMLHGTIRNDDS